jgi:hypothetical protein
MNESIHPELQLSLVLAEIRLALFRISSARPDHSSKQLFLDVVSQASWGLNVLDGTVDEVVAAVVDGWLGLIPIPGESDI